MGLGAGGMAPPKAQAGIDACGDIHVEANAQCEVIPPGASCEAMCEPLAVRAACAAQLAAECDGRCNELPMVDCTAMCTADCRAECTVDPGEFDCEASCEADCSGRCDANCSADSNRASCVAKCEGSCSASCSANCSARPPSADCNARCDAGCKGSCEVDTNLDCQIDCQAMLQAECEVDVQGGCEVDCDSQEGALFCDGQYIDHGGKLEECADALRALLDIEVEGYSRGSSSCTNGSCMAEGEAGASLSSDCSVGRPGARSSGLGLLAMLGIAVGVAGTRKRRRSL